MRIETGTRELTTDDLATLRRVLAPLRLWLLQSHGQRGLRDCALGMTSVVIGLVGILVFGVSPLVAMLYIVLAPAFEGMTARVAVRHTEAMPARPFASPLHALAFVEAVIAAFRAQSFGAPIVARRYLPYAGVVTTSAPAGSPDALSTGSRARLPPIRSFLIYVATVMALWIVPLAQATAAIFDRWDWLGLAALLAISAAQVWTAWHDAHRVQRDPSWDRDWSFDPPPLGHLLFWRHYRLLLLLASVYSALLLGLIAATSLSASTSESSFVTTLEARLLPLAILLFAASGALHLLLLAAPRQARRKIAVMDVFDVDYAEHQLQRMARR